MILKEFVTKWENIFPVKLGEFQLPLGGNMFRNRQQMKDFMK